MIVGIDLGTTFSAIGYVNAVGAPTLCPDRLDGQRFHTPSIVHIGSRGCCVGDLVEQLLEEDPALSVCRFPKSGLGRPESVYTDHFRREYSAEAMVSLLLRKLKIDAETAREPITRAVISIPAHFTEIEREAMVSAAQLADLPIVGLVEEPVAAAMFVAGLNPGREKILFVFDLGGGTLDATILQSTPEGLRVIATEGAPNVGGRNFDEIIMELVLEQYRAQFRHDPSEDAEAMQTLRRFATRLKLELSQPKNQHVSRPLLLAGRNLRVTLSRAQFETAAEPWISACQEVCRKVLAAANNLPWSGVDELFLVGGSSQLPLIERALASWSKIPPDRIRRQQPRSAVAYGAALFAEKQYGYRDVMAPPLRQLVSSNQLGLRAMDPENRRSKFHVMIDRNVPLPAVHRQDIYISDPKQNFVAIEVLQRKEEGSAPIVLGGLKFGPIERPKVNYRLELALGYDEQGRVSIRVRDPLTAHELAEAIDSEGSADLANTYKWISKLEIQA